MKNEIKCPVCGRKTELITYRIEEQQFEAYLLTCPHGCHHSANWQLTEEDAVSDFIGTVEKQEETLVSLGQSICGCELYVKISGNTELIPHRKETIKAFLNHIVDKKIPLKGRVK